MSLGLQSWFFCKLANLIAAMENKLFEAVDWWSHYISIIVFPSVQEKRKSMKNKTRWKVPTRREKLSQDWKRYMDKGIDILKWEVLDPLRMDMYAQQHSWCVPAYPTAMLAFHGMLFREVTYLCRCIIAITKGA